MEDTHSLWYRVLSARYGVAGGRLMGAAVMLPYGGGIFVR